MNVYKIYGLFAYLMICGVTTYSIVEYKKVLNINECEEVVYCDGIVEELTNAIEENIALREHSKVIEYGER